MPNIGKRLLLIDDDEQLVSLLALGLSKAGYSVEATSHASQGYGLALHNEYDAIILDILMPEQSGLEISHQLRAKGILTPILVLSGQTDKATVVQGLDAGADDYVTKPFSSVELAARVKALLRRNQKNFHCESLERAGLVLHMPLRTVRFGQASIVLTPKEMLLLQRLMAEAPQPVARLGLLQDVWGISGSHASNRLDVYIRRLRKKLVALCADKCIYTVRSGGYYFHKAVSPP